jgi:putative Holliday junction resolvase
VYSCYRFPTNVSSEADRFCPSPDKDVERQIMSERSSTGPRRVLGLDVGTKTIGIAVSDDLGLLAHPLRTLAREGVRKDVERLVAIARTERVAGLVVGLPYELDGSEGRSARLARQVGDALGEALAMAPVYVDERYTSVDATRQLIEADVSRAARKAVIDQQAAVLILQSFLDHGDWTRAGERGDGDPA